MEQALVQKFWSNVEKTPNCWIWRAGLKNDGYGNFQYGGRLNKTQVQAHRVAYILTKGDIPEGLQLDHLCRNRACVNPAHLEPVTCQINLLRGQTTTAANSRKSHCPQGHEYTPENTYLYERQPGRFLRYCKACWYSPRKKLTEQKYRTRNRDKINERAREAGWTVEDGFFWLYFNTRKGPAKGPASKEFLAKRGTIKDPYKWKSSPWIVRQFQDRGHWQLSYPVVGFFQDFLCKEIRGGPSESSGINSLETVYADDPPWKNQRTSIRWVRGFLRVEGVLMWK